MFDFTTIGWVHMIFGLLALASGTAVILARKGTRGHRFWGYFYFFNMLATNATSLVLYELTGTFNFFHASALFSLIVLTIGMIPVFTRRPQAQRGWLQRHAFYMTGSYLGVVLATAAEITSRVPGWDFGVAVAATVIIGSVIGVALMQRYVPRAIDNLSPRRRQPLQASGD